MAAAYSYSDFAVDIWLSLRFYIDSLRGKEYTKASQDYEDRSRLLGGNLLDLESAFRGGLPTITLPSWDGTSPNSKHAEAIDPQRPYILRNVSEDDGFDDGASYPPSTMRRVPYTDATPSPGYVDRPSADHDADYLSKGK